MGRARVSAVIGVWRSAIAVAIVALMAGVVAPAQAQRRSADDQIDAPEVKRVVLQGVKALDDDELRESIATEPSHCNSLVLKPLCAVTKHRAVYTREYLDRKEFKRDVVRIRVFYFKRGYREAQVDTVVQKKGKGAVTIVFRVREGPPTLVTAISVTGTEDVLPARTLRRGTVLRVGQPLNLFRIDTTITRLQAAMWERGRADAVVSVGDLQIDDSLHQAQVRLEGAPGAISTVADVHIDGNRDVSDRVIRNSLSFDEGDVFKFSDLVRSQRSLYESGLFKRATVTILNPDSARAGPDSLHHRAQQYADSAKTIQITVQETPAREARISTGFNTADFVQVGGRYTHNNFFGGARRLELSATIGNLLSGQLNDKGIFRNVIVSDGDDRARFLAPTFQASAEVRQRWFGSPKNTISAGIFAHRRSAPSVFVDRGYGASASFTRELALRVPATASYRFEITSVDAGDVYFCVNYGVCDGGTVDALRSAQRFSPLTLTLTVDRSDDPFFPRHGYLSKSEAEHASAFTVSDYRYHRLFTDNAVYLPMGKRGVLAGHVKLGWVRALQSTAEATGVGGDVAILHPRKRFYAGGAQSVRGYGENQLGPRVLTIPRARLRGVAISTNAGVTDTSFRFCDSSQPLSACNPNAVFTDTAGGKSTLADRDFTPRPLGGSSLLEGSVEYRFHVWGNFYGAGFLDGALVGTGNLRDVASATGALTPGLGMRYRSPVGPIRIDVGLNPTLVENLSVVTADENGRLVEVTGGKRRYGDKRGVLDRLTLHLSIGEAF